MAINTNMRVLVVDDFSTMRRIIKNILKQLGFNNIVEADDGAAAWEILNKDQVDFIVSDWNMPQMTGIELLRKVRASEEFADLPFRSEEHTSEPVTDRKSTRLNSSHRYISYAVFCLKKKNLLKLKVSR